MPSPIIPPVVGVDVEPPPEPRKHTITTDRPRAVLGFGPINLRNKRHSEIKLAKIRERCIEYILIKRGKLPLRGIEPVLYLP